MQESFYPDSRPWTRWWWFSGEIRREDVCYQLDWLKDNGFGGAEVAFLYPLPGSPAGPAWLSPEWSSIVAFAKREAVARGLGLDFTFGTLWPFGGSIVEERDASQTFDGPLDRRLERSWEAPAVGPILNHLDRGALDRYASRIGAALREAMEGRPPRAIQNRTSDATQRRPSGLFCDSWEVPVEKLWTHGFGKAFRERFGYELEPYMGNLDTDPGVRYDYRRLLSDFVLEQFYQPFGEICRRLGGFSRVQCHGAPTDLLAAYAAADVPESEAILFDPHFSQFAASAAALAGRPVVSCETFTCLYGWIPYPGPGPYQGHEQVADLKLLADAVMANGVNLVIWHGMPYNPPGGTNRFYASVEVGPGGTLAADLPAFNAYIERACAVMRRGTTASCLAVYLPLEDNRMRDRLPEPLRRPSAEYWWELQHQRFPEGAHGYRPLWVTAPFLAGATVEDGVLRAGASSFPGLLVDVEWLEAAALAEILRLARRGLPVCLRRRPSEPGTRKSVSFDRDLAALLSLSNVGDDLDRVCPSPSLVQAAGDDALPEFWARDDGDETLFFFAHPKSRDLSYPMQYGQSYCRETLSRRIIVRPAGPQGRTSHGRTAADQRSVGPTVDLDLRFEPYRSLLVTVGRRGGAKIEDLGYVPPEPVRLLNE
jgi:hypothetical protein